MNFQKILVPIVGILLLVGAYRGMGWAGVALVATGIVTWVLMYFTRFMKVMQRAADRPVGSVDSAVMLNVKLRKGDNLLHVMARTRSIGEALSPEGVDPEIFRWTDNTASHVTCTFEKGRLVKWELFRPEAPGDGATPPAP